MRSQNLFMLGVCGFVLAAIAYFLIVQKSPSAVLRDIGAKLALSTPSRAAEPEPAPETAAPRKKDPPPTRARATQLEPETAAIAPASAPQQPAPVAVSHPEVTDIRPGMQRAELLRRFPHPALQTSTLKEGDLVELIVYQGQNQRMATFAQLENGVVKQVYAGTAPPRALSR